MSPSSQRGVSLVIALFIIVVLALLGATMMRLFTSATDQVSHSILSTRALLTADSGAQLCLSDIFNSGSSNCGACSALTSGCSSSTTASFGGSSDWLNCSAQVTCCRIDPGTGKNHYRITSAGTCGPAGDQTVRRVEVLAKEHTYR